MRLIGLLALQVPADGACLYHACLRSVGNSTSFRERQELKAAAAAYLYERRYDDTWHEALIMLGERGAADARSTVDGATAKIHAALASARGATFAAQGSQPEDDAISYALALAESVEGAPVNEVVQSGSPALVDDTLVEAVMTLARMAQSDRDSAVRIAGGFDVATAAHVLVAAETARKEDTSCMVLPVLSRWGSFAFAMHVLRFASVGQWKLCLESLAEVAV